MKKPELMCPIRDWASLEACKKYANAVYFGVSELSMRAASGIEINEMEAFVKKCHSYGLKAYLTVNSVVYNPDIEKAEKLVKKAKKAGVDAIIVWDPAVILLAKENKVPFIISTQANISNWKSAEFYKSLGAKRLRLSFTERCAWLFQADASYPPICMTSLPIAVRAPSLAERSGRCPMMKETRFQTKGSIS